MSTERLTAEREVKIRARVANGDFIDSYDVQRLFFETDRLRAENQRLTERNDVLVSVNEALITHSLTLRAEQAEAEVKRLTEEHRDSLACLMIAHSFATGHGDTHGDLLKEFDAQLSRLREQRVEGLPEGMRIKSVSNIQGDQYGQWRGTVWTAELEPIPATAPQTEDK